MTFVPCSEYKKNVKNSTWMLCRCFTLIEERIFILSMLPSSSCLVAFPIIFISGPGGLGGKSLGISYYSYKVCGTLASSVGQNNSSKNISFHHVCVGEFSHPKDYLAFNLLQNVKLSIFLLLVCENIVSLKKSYFRRH